MFTVPSSSNGEADCGYSYWKLGSRLGGHHKSPWCGTTLLCSAGNGNASFWRLHCKGGIVLSMALFAMLEVPYIDETLEPHCLSRGFPEWSIAGEAESEDTRAGFWRVCSDFPNNMTIIFIIRRDT